MSTKNDSIGLLCWQDMLNHSRDVLQHVQCHFEACIKAIVQEAQNKHPNFDIATLVSKHLQLVMNCL